MRTKERRARIAIAGAGMGGAYLSRLLRKDGRDVDIFDVKSETKCGIAACGWAASKSFLEVVSGSGLAPEKYILQQSDHLVMDAIKLKADFMTVDKPRLIRDLLAGVKVRYGHLDMAQYDRIIDATGVARAYLPSVEDEVVSSCVQCRMQTDGVLENRVTTQSGGYTWCFRLSGHDYHVGWGSYLAESWKLIDQVRWLDDTRRTFGGHAVCRCTGNIRLTAPHYCRPFVTDGARDGVWGVGEAIGCVSPLGGDGLVYAMRSAQILIDYWDDPDAYTEAILEEFSWMTKARKVLDKVIRMNRFELSDARVLKDCLERMGVWIGIQQAATILMRFRRRH